MSIRLLYFPRFSAFGSPIVLRNVGTRRYISTTLPKLNVQAHAPRPKESRLKSLVREYGYSGIGVYLGIGFVDLSLCYLLVHSAGEEKIRSLQDRFLNFIGWNKDDANDQHPTEDKKKTSTIWTEFALAYALHKSLIVVRLPLTAAITPAIVKKLRGMGFDVGNIASATAKNVGERGLKGTLTKSGVKGIAKDLKYDPTASDPKFGKPPSKGQRWFF